MATPNGVKPLTLFFTASVAGGSRFASFQIRPLHKHRKPEFVLNGLKFFLP
jgi:hypothetical protein